MSDDTATGDTVVADGSKPVKISGATFNSIVSNIVEDVIYNIIHDTVISEHRREKLLRMRSAAVTAELQSTTLLDSLPTSKLSQTQPLPTPPKIETQAGVYENGRFALKGNPLHTVPVDEILCPHCRLPRLSYPITGAGSRVPDLSQGQQYCTRHPFVTRPGHDCYGNPFPSTANLTKKEREALKRSEKEENRATPSSQGDEGAPNTSSNAEERVLKKLDTGGKPASYIPWHTCPNCKRSLLITRFAQHLEKCLGISGRASSRNAMVKMGVNGVGSKGVEEDEEEDAPKKVKKRSSYVKKADREKLGPKGRREGSLLGNEVKRSGTPKREREKEEAEKPRKRMKLVRTESAISSVDGGGDEGEENRMGVRRRVRRMDEVRKWQKKEALHSSEHYR
ncbi:hypothetical protein H2199_008526 [Coniosporium tulheliwenetii]|uniref:Uncharacterized protein n=1 Tax=Coniosporium tulheliwenetii TaxID=3383036 RepID=A0ACC2YK73_9PEZI|nr:hypothetical protein H2199_008526 [Cladosporium sp. JES 115]